MKNSLGNLHKRPIPQWKDYGVKKVKYVTRPGEAADTLVARLPYNMQMTPVLKIRDRRGGSLIGIETDHSHAAGTDNIRSEYVTRKGVQKYESLGWMNGDYIFLIVPKGAAAKLLVAKNEPVIVVCDAWKRFARWWGLELNVVNPAVVRQADDLFASDIQVRKRIGNWFLRQLLWVVDFILIKVTGR